ncbi:MAG: phenylalanine--tRNA ligase subunit beta [Halobacteriovoraceae bacterium]|nr:phenylalanine--tRNA ligase subunit beta [Halobacteriovoraceae bacterium]|tara:strand:- start:464 stop:2890 length:2427 start_codon:yes stop_codon:yes gene_type:complete
MLISLNWVNDFVTLPNLDADDLANSFTMTTAEVEEVKTTFEHLKVIQVAQIKSLRKHPEADKLNLVTFDFGGKKTKEVVCGAPNVREGLKIPYAPLGTTLPNGLTLEPKKIRGILSDGMLCSEVELGLGEGSSGLMELSEDAPIGQSMLQYLDLKADTILDVDNKSLTHRPDLWGHYGIAREFAAAYEKELKKPFDKNWEKKLEAHFTSDKSPITPVVDKDSSGLGYFGLSLDGIEVGPSPAWMVARLEACGLRAINNIVDISNYVMLELGQPLHIFDRETIKENKIHIHTLKENTKFTTLDEMERQLIAGDTVISDAKEPLVLAGIMGGLHSGVTDKTKKIFIEVANWQAEEVRKTSTRLGLRTDSSQRFEKSLDTHQCYRTLLRTLELILELCPKAKVVGKAEYDGEDLSLFKPLVIKTSPKRISSVLGHEVSEDKLIAIFKSLDFEVNKADDDLLVTLPSFRTTKDIEYEACLIEEVGRIIGYDNIEPISPKSDIQTTRLEPAKVLTRKIQSFMTMHGHSLEIMTYPLIGNKLLEKAAWPNLNEELVLVNSLSKDADRMRPSLIPHALQTVALNTKNFSKFNFFEIGRSYLSDEKSFSSERHQLLVGMYSKSENVFLELINNIEKLLSSLNINYSLEKETGKFENPIVSNEWIGNHPHEHLHLRIMGKFQGVISSVHPLMLKNFKVKGNFSYAVIDFTDFADRPLKDKTKYVPISKFPSSQFDCTVLIDKKEPAANVLVPLKKLKVKELSSVSIVDVFALNDKQNSVTVRAVFEDPAKTLDSEAIKASEDAVVGALDKAGYPLKA